MKPVTVHGPGSEVASTFLNLLQRTAVGAQPASGGDATILTLTNGEYGNELASTRRGADVRHYQLQGLVDGQFAIVDRSLDWRDRLVDVVVFTSGLGTIRMIGAFDDTDLATLDVAVIEGVAHNRYLGTGAVSNVTTGAAVANGAPPLNAVGAVRSYAIELTSGLWLYASRTDGSLRLYNDTGSGLDVLLRVTGYGQTAKRSEPLPDGSAPATSPAPGASNNAAYLQGVPVNATPPTLGQALVFDGAEYVPATPGASGSLTTLPAGLDDAILWLDPDDLPGGAPGLGLRRWRARLGADAEHAHGTAPTLARYGGVREAVWAADGTLRVALCPSTADGKRTVVVVIRDVTPGPSGTDHVWHYGGQTNLHAYGLVTQISGSPKLGNHYWSTMYDVATSPSSSAQAIACVYNGAQDKLFVDGAQVGVTNAVALDTDLAELSLGARQDLASLECWRGALRLVLAWDRALTTDELTTLQAWIVARGLV